MTNSNPAKVHPEIQVITHEWVFSEDRLKNTPSVRLGMLEEQEMALRQKTCQFIRQIANQLKKSLSNNPNNKRPTEQCQCNAMYYMHRFYLFHPFQKYAPEAMAPCFLFLAAKANEEPIKLEYIVKTSYAINNPAEPRVLEVEQARLSAQLIKNENLLLQTLGFDLHVELPHTPLIDCGNLMGLKKESIRLAYRFASNNLHFTTMCLRFNEKTISCICINLLLKALGIDFLPSKEGKEWWAYLEPSLSKRQLEELTNEYSAVINKNKTLFNKWIPEDEKKNYHQALDNLSPLDRVPSSSTSSGQNKSPGLNRADYYASKHGDRNEDERNKRQRTM